MSTQKLSYEYLGFGVLTAHHCIIYDPKELPNIISGDKSIDNIKPIKKLAFGDSDALPFEMISFKPHHEDNFTVFCVGENGTTHSNLIPQALRLSTINLSNYTDCVYNTELRSYMEFSHSGRIWKNSKVVILKTYDNYTQDILLIRKMLQQQNIDISQYKLLYRRKNDIIDDKFCGDIISFNVVDICSLTDSIKL